MTGHAARVLSPAAGALHRARVDPSARPDVDDWAAQIRARLNAEHETALDRLLRIPGRVEAAIGGVLGGALLLLWIGRALRP